MGSPAVLGLGLGLGLGFVALLLRAHSTATQTDETAKRNDLPCVTCSEAMNTMSPCIGFLEGSGQDVPSPRCCLAGLRLTEVASTVETRKAVCQCFREMKFDPPIVLRRVDLLRQACVKNLPISSDPNQDCGTI